MRGNMPRRVRKGETCCGGGGLGQVRLGLVLAINALLIKSGDRLE